MERPSVQAPDTFYPGAVSHNTAAVKKPQGCNLSRILHFSCGERPSSGPAIRPAPAPQRKSGKNTEERLIFLFICGTVHFPGSASPAFSSPPLQPLFIMEEKTGVHAKEKACFRTVQDKFQGFRPVVLDLRQNTLDYLSRINK